MYIFDIENKSYLKDVLLENLKTLGVRGRLPKKLKEYDKENLATGNQIFQRPLHSLKKCITFRLNGSQLEVPEFIADACSVIEKNITVEGIFRKAGSTCKQKERKLELNQGKKVNCEYHVFDACSLVKLFFRELPQPVIPFLYHNLFLKCLLLSTYEKEMEALMLACLLLPEEHIAVLAFFMEFLLKVSWQAETNKMTVKNLAIILTPTLMPVSKETRASNTVEMANHFKIIEMLIKNSEKIGRVPDQILESILSVHNKKTKKKRRSGSLTRMFTGLKKIVGSRSSTAAEWEGSVVLTPESLSFVRKRKMDSTSALGLSAKKKQLLDCGTDNLSPSRCRMQGYAPIGLSFSSPSNTKKTRSRSPGNKNQQNHSTDKTLSERCRSEDRTSRLNLVRQCTVKNPKSEAIIAKANGVESIFKAEAKKTGLERKLSVKNWIHKKTATNDLLINEGELGYQDDSSEKAVDLSDELITVHRSEYEDIKNRVSALEEDLELLATVHSVQCVYEKTLEESERLNVGSTEKLARRLSQELKIRLSSENKIIRSPSARKIGSIRRRSQETVMKNSEQKTNLKRGRPNTLRTGLPSPRSRAASTESYTVTKATSIKRSSTCRTLKEDWKTGEIFFSKEHLLQKLSPTHGRPSLAEIRCQNAGMVLEKAKLFNALNAKSENGTAKVLRRQSVRLENLRRMNDTNHMDKKLLTRTRSLGSDKKPKSTALLMEGGVHSKMNSPDLQIISESACTPKCQRLQGSALGSRATPAIKKSLITRSPRSFAKTPMSNLRSGNRPRATPMRALPETGATPHLGLRRSPRLLVRSINTPSRPTPRE